MCLTFTCVASINIPILTTSTELNRTVPIKLTSVTSFKKKISCTQVFDASFHFMFSFSVISAKFTLVYFSASSTKYYLVDFRARDLPVVCIWFFFVYGRLLMLAQCWLQLQLRKYSVWISSFRFCSCTMEGESFTDINGTPIFLDCQSHSTFCREFTVTSPKVPVTKVIVFTCSIWLLAYAVFLFTEVKYKKA